MTQSPISPKTKCSPAVVGLPSHELLAEYAHQIMLRARGAFMMSYEEDLDYQERLTAEILSRMEKPKQ